MKIRKLVFFYWKDGAQVGLSYREYPWQQWRQVERRGSTWPHVNRCGASFPHSFHNRWKN
jgi:hypothetical protein